MNIHPLKTHAIKPGELFTDILDRYVDTLTNGTILAITSKILSLCQGRVVPKSSVRAKEDLIKQEAEAYLKEDASVYGIHLTIQNHMLIPSAGIDESNGEGVYILYPQNIQETALEIWRYLRQKHGLNQVGVIITDSHTTPLRKGVTGICLGWCGLEPLYSYVGKPDIFGTPLRVTQINILDALAAAAVFIMGEGAEQTPMALIKEAPRIHFLLRPPTVEEERSICIPMEEDLYAPLLKSAEWVWNQKG